MLRLQVTACGVFHAPNAITHSAQLHRTMATRHEGMLHSNSRRLDCLNNEVDILMV